MTEKHPDVWIPEKMLGSQGLDFNLLPVDPQVDEEFKEVYFGNNELATERYLPHIYNYFRNFQDKVNLPANFVSSPWGSNTLHENKVTAETITWLYGVGEYQYAVDYYKRWLEENLEMCREFGIRTVNLFYWEERIANCFTQIQLDKDIAQDDINPLNSRLLNELFMAVPLTYNNVPDYVVYKKVIKELWPELLEFPVNPSRRKSVQLVLKRMGLLGMVFRMMYKTARG